MFFMTKFLMYITGCSRIRMIPSSLSKEIKFNSSRNSTWIFADLRLSYLHSSTSVKSWIFSSARVQKDESLVVTRRVLSHCRISIWIADNDKILKFLIVAGDQSLIYHTEDFMSLLCTVIHNLLCRLLRLSFYTDQRNIWRNLYFPLLL